MRAFLLRAVGLARLALPCLALVAGGSSLIAQEATTVHRGSRKHPVSGVLVDRSRVQVFGSGGLVAEWDAVQGPAAVTPEDAAARGLALQPHQRFVFSDAGRAIARTSHEACRHGVVVDLEVQESDRWTRIVTLEDLYFFFLSDDGSSFVALRQDIHRPKATEVRIYDRAGILQGSPLAPPWVQTVRISAQGETVVVNAADSLHVLRRDGALVARFSSAIDCRLSRDGSKLAASYDGPPRVEVFERGESWERLDRTIPTASLPHDLAFDPDAHFLAVVDGARLYRLDLESDEGPREDGLPEQRGDLRSVQPDGMGGVLVGSLEVAKRETREGPGRAEAFVTFLSPTLNTGRSARIETTDWSADSPAARFFDTGRHALIQIRDHVLVMPR